MSKLGKQLCQEALLMRGNAENLDLIGNLLKEVAAMRSAVYCLDASYEERVGLEGRLDTLSELLEDRASKLSGEYDG